ncbi:hypothetical protein D9M68_960100 [compost metagenome]
MHVLVGGAGHLAGLFLDGVFRIAQLVARIAQVFIDAVAQFHDPALGLVGRGLHQLLGIGNDALQVGNELFLSSQGVLCGLGHGGLLGL